MFEKELLIDGKLFSESQKISAKRPTEYWLAFIKRYIFLHKKKSKFSYLHLLLFVPIIIPIGLYATNAVSHDAFIGFMILGIIVSIIASIIAFVKFRTAFVPINAFHDLAKFIISIKNDIYKKRFEMRLNSGNIINDTYRLDPETLGITIRKGSTYKPYEVERFKVNFILKDGSVCTLALHQITLSVSTRKRRSSGKIKTKTKHKHKFFHLLTLKLKDTDYAITNAKPELMANDRFNIQLHTENGFHYIKVKAKMKMSHVPNKLKDGTTHKTSLYTEMITYLNEHHILTSTKPKLIS